MMNQREVLLAALPTSLVSFLVPPWMHPHPAIVSPLSLFLFPFSFSFPFSTPFHRISPAGGVIMHLLCPRHATPWTQLTD
ncbi:hypothetical protein IWZ03DRAFT_373454 [Phyllosticta citriasiana]|uniref:Secreted protein n=1 Tax=Phyllosticta citriasiana TaxID=595635 RepID=A0ABR1KSY0_9PEZI